MFEQNASQILRFQVLCRNHTISQTPEIQHLKWEFQRIVYPMMCHVVCKCWTAEIYHLNQWGSMWRKAHDMCPLWQSYWEGNKSTKLLPMAVWKTSRMPHSNVLFPPASLSCHQGFMLANVFKISELYVPIRTLYVYPIVSFTYACIFLGYAKIMLGMILYVMLHTRHELRTTPCMVKQH